jgi:hypothetical protein
MHNVHEITKTNTKALSLLWYTMQFETYGHPVACGSHAVISISFHLSPLVEWDYREAATNVFMVPAAV